MSVAVAAREIFFLLNNYCCYFSLLYFSVILNNPIPHTKTFHYEEVSITTRLCGFVFFSL